MSDRFHLGAREIDLERREVRCGNDVVPLSANEVGLLSVLVARAGEVVERDALLVEGLGYHRALNTRAIDQAIWRLRKKLEDEPQRPVYLRSEPGVGYQLVLAPERSVRLVGRRAEREALERWISQGETEICVVGPPGIGRSALIASLEPVPPGVTLRVSTDMPSDPDVRALRLGLLSDEDASTLLVDRVLSRRGTAALGRGESGAVAPLLGISGGHPAAIEALADEAVLHTLDELLRRGPPAPSAALVAFAAGLPREVAAAAGVLAAIPDALPASEASELVGPSLLVSAWRASAVEAVDRGSGRWFVVAPPVRAALVGVRAPPAAERLERLRDTLVAQAELVLTAGSSAARSGLWARRETVRWLVEETGDRALLKVLLAMPLLQPLPRLPDPGDDVDARVCHGLLLASELEHVRPREWAEQIEALSRLSPSPDLERAVAQRRVSMLQHTRAPLPELALAVARSGRVSERIGTPFARATHLLSSAVLAGRIHDLDGANADLIEALRLFEQLGAEHHAMLVYANLGTFASLDGRCQEGIVWIELMLDRLAPSASVEASQRLVLVDLFLATGRVEDAQRQLDLVEALGSRPTDVELGRAWCELAGGRPERAEVRARAVLAAPLKVPGYAEQTIGWARLLQGDPTDAAPWLTALDDEGREGDAFSFELLLTSVVAMAAVGRADEAERRFGSASGRAPRWWGPARAVVSAWIDHARGLPVEVEPLRERLSRDAIRHTLVNLASDALAVAVARSADG